MSIRNTTHVVVRRASWTRPLRALLWCASGAMMFAIPFVLVAFPGRDLLGTPWLFPAAVLCALLAGWTGASSARTGRRTIPPWPLLLGTLGSWAGCVGAGLLLGRAGLSVRSSPAGTEYEPAPQVIGIGAMLLIVAPAALVSSVLLRSRSARSARGTGMTTEPSRPDRGRPRRA
ncbi:hypothetical protein [Brachybacterium hainanense]|uniref:Uncharacterized protein n=1 Tax=Brachybacterium hainanense TaxID=1541174 RepID=A0ABV6R8X8_9MICO